MATSGFKHGVYTREEATQLVPGVTVDSNVVFAVGTAAVHKLSAGNRAYVNELRMYQSYSDYVQEMGWDEECFGDYSLQELVYSHFALYGATPIVVCNVFDPVKHKASVVEESLTFATVGTLKNMARLPRGGITSLVLKSADGNTTYSAETDYAADAATGLVTRLDTGTIPAGATAKASYSYADVSLVTSSDIIGGVDQQSGESLGLELVADVFPKFRLVVGSILAPKFSEDPAVAVVMAAKCEGINGVFEAIALADIPCTGHNAVTKYTELPSYKETNNLTDERLLLCWPRVKLGTRTFGLATQLAGVMSKVDSDRGGIPYASPSNKRLEVSSVGYEDVNAEDGWKEVWLGLEKANYLNGQGIYTAINFVGGIKTWGGRTAVYPSNTDPKDCQDAVRRMFNWYRNQFVLNYFSKVDEPLGRRQIQTILRSEQIRLDGLKSQGCIIDGKISFLSNYNPLTDLVDGLLRFKFSFTPPPVNRAIEGIFEFDPDALTQLFS